MSRPISAFAGFLVALVVCLAGPDAAQPVQAQAAVLQGILVAQWGDPMPGSADAPRLAFSLTDDAGVAHAVTFAPGALEAAGGITAVDRKAVVLTGAAFPAEAADVATPNRFTAHGVSVLDAPMADGATALTGSQPFATILCKFADIATEPKTVGYFNGLLGTTYPGMDHYWREQSYNNININGSVQVNWVTLPKARSLYFNVSGAANLNLLANDCAQAADSQVHFPSFVGINFVFNGDLDCCAWGGGVVLNNLDGFVSKVYRGTWMPPWSQGPGVFGHEMGHAFGFPHSSGMYGQTYDNRWDVMSTSANGFVSVPPYGAVPAHTITYHKDIDGWIPDARKFTATQGSHTITLERLAQPTAGNTYLMAKVPVPGAPTRFYTVEARRRVGYDTNLWGDAIIIHDVVTNRSGASPALVVDVDNNGNTGDAGAMFVPGETFNGASGISITVNSANATGWSVTITIPSPCNPTISPSSASIGNTGGSGSVGVSVAAGCAWSATSNAPWITLTSGTTGNGSGSAWYSAAFNGTTSPRSGTVTIAGHTFTLTQAASTAVTPGDLNADGRMDLLWHHRVTGQIATWFMNGTNRLDVSFLTPSMVASLDWQPVGMGDFNADSRADILWQNVSTGQLYVWFMNGTTMTDGAYLTNSLSFDTRWRVRSVTDLNRDGRPDLVLQHPVDGLIAAWLLNGTTFVDGSLLNPGFVSPDWRVAGAGDFNADGKQDLVFQHNEGYLAVWFMDGVNRLDAAYLSPDRIVDTRWLLSGVGDVNGDGKPDLILHHTWDGVAAVWLMNGTTMLDGALFNPPAVPDANWRIVGPR